MGKERLGFMPCRSDGSPCIITGRTFYWAGSNTVNMGDIVILDVNGFANSMTDSTNASVLGPVIGMQPVTVQDLSATTVSLSGTTTNPDLNRHRLSAAGYVRVSTDRRQYFRACCNKAMVTANIGETCNILLGADPTASNIGRSGHQLHAGEIGTSNLGLFKIVGIPRDPDRYANEVIVHLNRSVFDPFVAGI